ncbi:DnaJ domain-containing protein [Fulvivirga sedimenti]|uniref:DnaJ domain-containing protein n=1 Tax=Fulvivirga sedimenti TaxID=2879465 RepID=UPI0023DFF0F7|nr:DnaJ domain-containing protein [Fulvivirga sedimenti]
MQNYYELLGISSTASDDEIKKAYKKLAIRHHPDKNDGNSAAEEKFKQINEAYQVLSNPEKRSRYDFILEYGHIAYSAFEKAQEPVRKRPPIYPRYARFKDYGGTDFGRHKEYQVDRKYFRDLFLSLGLFVILSGFFLGFYWLNDYISHREMLRIREESISRLNEAQEIFSRGDYRTALQEVSTLAVRIPNEERYSEARDQMLNFLRSKAADHFNEGSYDKSVETYVIVKDFEEPLNLNTWYQIAMCEYKMGEYRKAVHALDYILIRDRNNLSLLLEIAGIYDHNLNEPTEALAYYNDAKALFKKFQATSYGEAFELVMPVDQTPDIYFELFMKRADLNSRLNNIEEAITDCNWAVFLRPTLVAPYMLRARMHLRQQDVRKACADWTKATELGNEEAEALRRSNCGF